MVYRVAMLIHSGPVMAFALLLAASGIMKLRDPKPTQGALRASGLPSTWWLVGLLASSELAIGFALVVTGGPVAAGAMGVLYLAFGLFVVNALRHRLPISSCGCFGRADTPPSWIHVVVNASAVAVSALAVAQPLGSWGGLVVEPVEVWLPFVAFTIVSVYLLYGVLAVLPRNRSRETLVPLSPTRAGAGP